MTTTREFKIPDLHMCGVTEVEPRLSSARRILTPDGWTLLFKTKSSTEQADIRDIADMPCLVERMNARKENKCSVGAKVLVATLYVGSKRLALAGIGCRTTARVVDWLDIECCATTTSDKS